MAAANQLCSSAGRGSSEEMAGNGFGVSWLCLTLSLGWDLSGSSQILNLNLSKILGDP